MDGFPYAEHLEWRMVSGKARERGPADVWVRARVPLVAGERPSTLQRLVLVADSASGVSSVLDWDDWSFANVDLDVHLMRPSQDDWVLMEAVSEVGAGLGLARSRLSDRAGLLGGARSKHAAAGPTCQPGHDLPVCDPDHSCPGITSEANWL
jgi:hypothetical protein